MRWSSVRSGRFSVRPGSVFSRHGARQPVVHLVAPERLEEGGLARRLLLDRAGDARFTARETIARARCHDVATLSDLFASPTSGAQTVGVTSVAWAVASDGHYGKSIPLPEATSSESGSCSSTSTERTIACAPGRPSPLNAAYRTPFSSYRKSRDFWC